MYQGFEKYTQTLTYEFVYRYFCCQNLKKEKEEIYILEDVFGMSNRTKNNSVRFFQLRKEKFIGTFKIIGSILIGIKYKQNIHLYYLFSRKIWIGGTYYLDFRSLIL